MANVWQLHDAASNGHVASQDAEQAQLVWQFECCCPVKTTVNESDCANAVYVFLDPRQYIRPSCYVVYARPITNRTPSPGLTSTTLMQGGKKCKGGQSC